MLGICRMFSANTVSASAGWPIGICRMFLPNARSTLSLEITENADAQRFLQILYYKAFFVEAKDRVSPGTADWIFERERGVTTPASMAGNKRGGRFGRRPPLSLVHPTDILSQLRKKQCRQRKLVARLCHGRTAGGSSAGSAPGSVTDRIAGLGTAKGWLW